MLADIGNTHIHIYDGVDVIHLAHDVAISKYAKQDISYISVNTTLQDRISTQTNWIDISSDINLNGAYEGMGIDRQALCLSHSDGIFIDAGSAITIDIMDSGVYRGGFIMLGLNTMIEGYRSISKALHTTINREISIDKLPKTTRDGITYGIIAPIISIIKEHQNGKPTYFTGGDGKLLSSFVDGAIYDETILFRGIEKSINKKNYYSKDIIC